MTPLGAGEQQSRKLRQFMTSANCPQFIPVTIITTINSSGYNIGVFMIDLETAGL